MRQSAALLFWLLYPISVLAQLTAEDLGLVSLGDNDGKKDDESDENYENDIIVISNQFPKDLNFFCNPSNELMRDRLCYGQVDAYALACAEDTPPMHLVPFCLAFKRHCSLINYPADDWCAREFDRYDDFCTETKRRRCKSCSYDLSCYCEPYECLWKRHGFNTAVWCQRYELFCNEKQRRKKAKELIALMEDAVKIHYRCMHLFNLPKVICDPFRRQFDYNRCMKFLFDCELISEWDSGEDLTSKEATKEGERPEVPKKTLKPTPEDTKLAEKIAEEEKALERLLEEKEKEEKLKQNRKPEGAATPSPVLNVTIVETMPTTSNFSKLVTGTEAIEKKPRSASFENPFSACELGVCGKAADSSPSFRTLSRPSFSGQYPCYNEALINDHSTHPHCTPSPQTALI